MTLPSLNDIEMEKLLACSYSFYSDSPLLNSSVVRSRIQDCFDRSDEVMFKVRSHSVLFYDFTRREQDIFFVDRLNRFYAKNKVEPALYSPFWPTFSMCMIHSAGVVRGDRAALFLAHDGGGKSTVARTAPPETILSDDQVLLRKENDIFTTAGTPWGLITNNIEHVPLGGVFLLEQAEHFELVPIQPGEMLEFLWMGHRSIFFSLPRDLKIWVVEFLSKVCFSLPVYRMRFALNNVDWEAIDVAMAAGRK
jgi:hypothetical protein